MLPLLELWPLVLKSYFTIFKQVIFWLPVVIVALLYRKMTKATSSCFKTPGVSPWRLTLYAVFCGVLGGFLGSCLLVLLGVSVNEIGAFYLLGTALGLMLIQQRFLCFAYAGGLLSLVSLLFGFPQINVPQVMALVAVLHLIEAGLIYFTGAWAVLPVCVATGKGQIVGGYNLQKFWPMPLVLLFAGIYPAPEIIKGVISLPDWWPLLKSQFVPLEGEMVYSLLAIPAVLGYGDVALSISPVEKTRLAGRDLAIYSLVLLGLAIGAGHFSFLAYLAALFAPGGHELVIYLGRRREMTREPLFAPAQSGLRFLYLQRRSPWAQAGIQAGDLLLAVEGQAIFTEKDLRERLEQLSPGHCKVEIKYEAFPEQVIKTVKLTLSLADLKSCLFVPPSPPRFYGQVVTSSSFIGKWSRKIGSWFFKKKKDKQD